MPCPSAIADGPTAFAVAKGPTASAFAESRRVFGCWWSDMVFSAVPRLLCTPRLVAHSCGEWLKNMPTANSYILFGEGFVPPPSLIVTYVVRLVSELVQQT